MSHLAVQRPAFARCLPFVVFVAALALRGAVADTVDTRWLYALQAGASALALAVLWEHYGELRCAVSSLRRPLDWALSIAAGLGVFVLWIALTAPWMRVGEPVTTFVPVDVDGNLQWGLIVLRATGAAVVVPLVEELFWRSFLMRWIDRRNFLSLAPQQTSLYAWLSSSAVFALAHDMWLAGLLAGLVFAAIYRRSGQIWHAITAHAVANLALAVWVVGQRAWGFW